MQETPAKLYVAVCSDLTPGQQLAQAVHAAFEFSTDYPSRTMGWRLSSNYLVVVAVPDEDALWALHRQSLRLGLEHTMVQEPDYQNRATALVLAPGNVARRLCRKYPLALKEPVMT